MGGGDLNMKKSWHPLLIKNQERVWIEEKKALEEKKKLDQLRKEKEEERQMQELQRLQEEQTGKKRTEKLEWMYATPATGTSQNSNDLEDYLLGKKRVDKILTADENAKVGAAHKNFIAVQNANNARDIAAKIREDPLLAIKQQEQAAYQALMSNPLRLREMQERNGIKPKKDKKAKKLEKEERKRLKHELKHERKHRIERSSRSLSPADNRLRRERSRSRDRHSRSRRSPSPDDRRSRSRSRSRSPLPSRSRLDGRRSDYPVKREPSFSPPPDSYRRRRDSRSPVRDSRIKAEERHVRVWPRSDDSDEGPRSRSPDHRERERGGKRPRSRSRSRSPARYERNSYAKRSRMSPPPPPPPPPPRAARQADAPRSMADNAAEARAARLAAMSSNATSMSTERQQRLALMLEKEKAELARDEEARIKSKGMGGFLSQEQKKVFGGTIGLEDRIRRGSRRNGC
ncbi:Pre-mRNA splicing factor-domain-containing protein [Mycena epipterygia]|nr:Pre-mRNA splicing factor-domain-containing protein [Mycena epipterygia]